MTINQLLVEADRGRHAKADYGLESSFRNRLWPRFLTDIDINVGNTSWRSRSDGQLEIGPGQHSAVLPLEVGRVNRAWISGPATTGNGLAQFGYGRATNNIVYIGDDAHRIAVATEQLARASGGLNGVSPTGWWLELLPTRADTPDADTDQPLSDVTQNAGWMFRLDYPVAETTMIRFVYQLGSSLENDAAFPLDYDLNRLILHQYQWALISLIRADLLADRYSDGDERVAYESGIYNTFLTSLRKRPSAGPGGETRVTFR